MVCKLTVLLRAGCNTVASTLQSFSCLDKGKSSALHRLCPKAAVPAECLFLHLNRWIVLFSDLSTSNSALGPVWWEALSESVWTGSNSIVSREQYILRGTETSPRPSPLKNTKAQGSGGSCLWSQHSRSRDRGISESETSLVYGLSSRMARAITQRNPVLTGKKKKSLLKMGMV